MILDTALIISVLNSGKICLSYLNQKQILTQPAVKKSPSLMG